LAKIFKEGQTSFNSEMTKYW